MTQHSFLPVKVKSNFTEGWRRVRSRKRSGAFNARVKNMTRGGECVATVVQGGRGRMMRTWRSTFSFQFFTRIVQETQKKKALIHWHIKGRQTQSSLQINAHYSQNEPLHNLSTWTQVLENGMCSVGKLEAYWWKWRCQKERIIANRFERGQLSVAVLINLYAFSCRKAKSCAVMFYSRCFWWCGSLMWPLKTCCPAQMMW